MSLCLGKCIRELKASEFKWDLSGGEEEPLVVSAGTAALWLSVLACHWKIFPHRQVEKCR